MSIPDSRLPLASPRETHFALHPDEKTAILPSQELQDQGCWSWREKSPWIALALFALVAAVFLILHGRDEANPATETTWKGDAGIAKEWTFSEPIQLLHKPEADQRLYQYYVLPNGMHVLNVQDNDTRQMAMAVAVRAGSFDDPKELPGLAHFCEHMLFLGTEKYPQLWSSNLPWRYLEDKTAFSGLMFWSCCRLE
ncbi:unnamed protein product [Polarella glacialis]|uniref:Peptidase M16 N-terminal domain-containing protein n=1 Tax=Polarella glacialis TaxID=89957 RepID=A0A813LSU4_POLGL|nr:unnamed protein product [Polarella glacialis]